MQTCRRLLKCIFLVSIILELAGCGMVDSYKLFCFEGISYISDKEDLHNKEYEFAKLENVLFVPEIKEVNHNEYIIYVSAYSETGAEQVAITNVKVQSLERELINYDLCEEVYFGMEKEGLYAGWINGGIVKEDDLEIDDEEIYSLTINVDLQKDDANISKTLVFPFTINKYKSFVMPT